MSPLCSECRPLSLCSDLVRLQRANLVELQTRHYFEKRKLMDILVTVHGKVANGDVQLVFSSISFSCLLFSPWVRRGSSPATVLRRCQEAYKAIHVTQQDDPAAARGVPLM